MPTLPSRNSLVNFFLPESYAVVHNVHVKTCRTRRLPQPTLFLATIHLQLRLQEGGAAMLRLHQVELPIRRQHARLQQLWRGTALRPAAAGRTDRVQRDGAL